METRASPLIRVVPSWVSPTFSASARTSTGGVEIGAPEHDAGVGRRRPQGHQNLLTGVQADTLGADGVFESALSEHLIVLPLPFHTVLG